MSRWECIVCGWVYDEAKGWPDDGIVAGTKWEDVPEGWLCPDCGVGKEDFELIAEKATPAAPHHEAEDQKTLVRPVVIIGTGLAGYNLAKEFRKLDKDTPLLIITSDDGANYSKPMLSTGYTKNTDAKALALESAGQMAHSLNASVWTFTRVTAIDTTKQELKVGDAITVAYSKLVIAWGAETIKPPIEGDGRELVYSINDLLDYDDFRIAMDKSKAKKIAIIGGGLIGCEFTNDLLNGGFEIEAIDPLSYCLPTLLPEAAGKAVQRALEAKGAKFHFGPLVTHVNKRAGGGVTVVMNNGQTIDADVVVSAVGVRARTELAKKSGITCNRGVVGNKFCETSAANVYTLGDCAEIEGNLLYYVLPLMACARALAKTLTGTRTAVTYPAMPVMIKTPACPVVVAPAARDAQGSWNITEDGNNVIAEFRAVDGKLLGFALTGASTSEKVRLQKELPPVMP